MIDTRTFHTVASSLPLPLAQALRRAVNAKSPEGQHLAAYYFFESSLKLAAAAQVAAYVQIGCPDGNINRVLGQLMRPSVGHWLGLLKEVSRHLECRADAKRLPLAGLHQRLLQRQPLEAAKSFCDFAGGLENKAATGSSLSAFELFETVVAYRNQEIAHGARRRESVYAEGGRLLVLAVLESLERLQPFGKLQLAVARDHAEAANSGVRRSYEALSADGFRLPLNLPILPEDNAVRAGQLVLAEAEHRVSLFPLLVYDIDEFERDRVGFLNRVTLKRSLAKEGLSQSAIVGVDYLDYDSGDHLHPDEARAGLFQSGWNGAYLS
jgi:hypothetical protein